MIKTKKRSINSKTNVYFFALFIICSSLINQFIVAQEPSEKEKQNPNNTMYKNGNASLKIQGEFYFEPESGQYFISDRQRIWVEASQDESSNEQQSSDTEKKQNQIKKLKILGLDIQVDDQSPRFFVGNKSSGIYLEKSGQHTIKFNTRDPFNEKGRTESIKLNVDKTPPKITVLQNIKAYGKKLYVNTLSKIIYLPKEHTIIAQALDTESNLKYLMVDINGSGYKKSPKPKQYITLTKQGINIVRIKALDNVFNETRERYFVFYLDDQKPCISVETQYELLSSGETFSGSKAQNASRKTNDATSENRETLDSSANDETSENRETLDSSANDETSENRETLDSSANDETSENRETLDSSANDETSENRETLDSSANDETSEHDFPGRTIPRSMPMKENPYNLEKSMNARETQVFIMKASMNSGEIYKITLSQNPENSPQQLKSTKADAQILQMLSQEGQNATCSDDPFSKDGDQQKQSASNQQYKDFKFIDPKNRIFPLAHDHHGSGMDKIEYRWQGGKNWQTYSVPLIITAPGHHVIEFRAIDKVGNISDIFAIPLILEQNNTQTTLETEKKQIQTLNDDNI